MSLSSSMWTSVSGLLTHGEKMNVIGNNLANVSTIGFKAQRADFSDFFYTDYGTPNGQAQVGKGTAIAALIGDYSQGGFENTNSGTDLAINGNGFFKVKDSETNASYYTRAGDFYFDENRQLINPNKMVLQGWKVAQDKSIGISLGDAVGTSSSDEIRHVGLVNDIVLDQWNIAPTRTTNVTIANNLVNNDSYDLCKSTSSPFTALFDTWDATQQTPLADGSYATQSTIAAYDEGGNAHTLTVYMDKVNSTYEQVTTTSGTTTSTNTALSNLPAGYSVYEYLVTMDPKDDMRQSNSGVAFYDQVNGTVNQTKAGVLMSGLMVFDESGTLVNQSAYTYNGTGATTDGDFSSNKANWEPTKFSSNGLPIFSANFAGKEGGSTVFRTGNTYTDDDKTILSSTIIELDLGLNVASTANPWAMGVADSTGARTTTAYSSQTLANATDDLDNVAFMATTVRDSNATANNGTNFQVDIQDDGYAAGLLSNYKIDADGIVYGYYDNGENIPLYQIAMYDFHSTQGLRRDGGNMFTPTPESGAPVEGVAGKGTFGDISSYYIENSNVDMSREFVHMISCQRGFQANSKSITTTDTMLETVINMKR
ncbi:MAG: flagellar hook-basal body complex protein [Desulfovibrio sp.]|nr:flagellar hook-basal body complex protein [Desulfovibrio sp.]